MITEKEMLKRLASMPLSFPPLEFERRDIAGRDPFDLSFEAAWDGRRYWFAAEVRARATAQGIIAAAHRARSRAKELGVDIPLVIVPYLSPSHVDEAERLGVSVVDLCGNGVIKASPQLFILRSGRPNLFPDSRPIKGPYRGTSSLVARALVLRQQFDRVSEVRDFIAAHGGSITLGTVSKALHRLADDLVIVREGNAVRVVQPDKLLEKLRESYRQPKVSARWTGKVPLPDEEIATRLLAVAEHSDSRLVLTGIASANRYVAIAAERVLSFYCSLEPQRLLQASDLNSSSSTSFPNVELLCTDEGSVYFDPRRDDGTIVSSPIQTWLELVSGDKRTREASESLRTRLLAGNATPVEKRDGR
jgi:hypothetical protein